VDLKPESHTQGVRASLCLEWDNQSRTHAKEGNPRSSKALKQQQRTETKERMADDTVVEVDGASGPAVTEDDAAEAYTGDTTTKGTQQQRNFGGGSVGISQGRVGEILGYKFFPSTRGELDSILFRSMVARVILFLVALLAFALALAGPFSGSGAVDWGIAVAIIAAIQCMVLAVLAYMIWQKKTDSSIVVKVFVYLGMFGDLIFVFATMSGFTSIAVVGSNCVEVNLPGFSLSCGETKAAAAFLFFAWLTYFYLVPLSFIIYMRQAILD